MGHHRDHTIVVTGDSHLDVARDAALACGNKNVSEIVEAQMNGLRAFFIAPDGSKEGWDTSNEGDVAREAFVTWLMSDQRVGVWDWVEVQFGDDDGDTKIIRDSDNIVRSNDGN